MGGGGCQAAGNLCHSGKRLVTDDSVIAKPPIEIGLGGLKKKQKRIKVGRSDRQTTSSVSADSAASNPGIAVSAILRREEAPSHLFAIPELDFSSDLFQDRLVGPWFRLGALTKVQRSERRDVEDVVMRESLLLDPDDFAIVFDDLDSIGDDLDGLGTLTCSR